MGKRKTNEDKARDEIIKQTKTDMETLGTYRHEFDVLIERYAEMRLQFDLLNKRWYEEGCKITEPYTNKAGATNERKTALYLCMEKLRLELTDTENILGMTPKGLQTIKKKGLEQKKQSALDRILSGK